MAGLLSGSGRTGEQAHRDEWWLRRGPGIVVAGTLGLLALSWLAVLAVDVLDLFGLRDFLFVRRASEYPYAFYHLFADNHPVEWAQWLLLVSAVVTVGVAAGMLRARREVAWGVVLLALALAVVALQDSGNQRHVAADLAAGVGGQTAATLVSLAMLAAAGLLALGGLLAAWPALRYRPAARNMFLAGYAVYGLMGVLDARSDVWYHRAGAAVLERGLGGRVLDAPASWEPGLLEWLVMDAFVEESLELAAAGLLAAAALLLLRAVTVERPRPPAAAAEPVTVR